MQHAGVSPSEHSSRLAQLVERKTLNLVVVGSSPTVGAFFLFFRPFPVHLEFLLQHNKKMSSDASIAQLAEHALRKRTVVGSIPTGGS